MDKDMEKESALTYDGPDRPTRDRRRIILAQDVFLARLSERNPSVTPLDPYAGSHTHIRAKCKECGYIWLVQPNNLLNGTGCPKCGYRHTGMKLRKTHEQFLLDIKERGNPNVEVLGTYISSQTKILCRCRVCQHEWDALPGSLLRGCGCKKCADAAKVGRKLNRPKR